MYETASKYYNLNEMKRENSSLPFQEYQYTINIIQVPGNDDKPEDFGSAGSPDPTTYKNHDISSQLLGDPLSPVFAFIPDNFTVFCYNQSYWKWSTLTSDVVVNATDNKLDWSELVNFTNCNSSEIGTEIPNDSFVTSSSSHVNWWGLVAILVLLITTLGNILVILAISWDRRLQNMTNYFLLSLAATDLMVAIFVMPIAIVVLVVGRFPFSSEFCLVWISFDVLFCSASIMHLCTISVDRFLSLRYPMKFGRHKTRKRVVLKLVLVWCLSLSTSMPLSLMYAADTRPTIVDGVCQIPDALFQIIGSLFSFYVPLVIMLVTYALTVLLLSKKESELMASVVDTPVTPVSHSVRLKRLLCKTTSTLSTTTATSIADTELSETIPSEDVESESATHSPGRRTAHYVRYAPHYPATGTKNHHRNFSVREAKGPPAGPSLNPRVQPDCHLRPPLAAASSVELSVYPRYNQEEEALSPPQYTDYSKRRHKRMASNGTRNPSKRNLQGASKSPQKDRFERGRCDKGHNVEIRISGETRRTTRESSLQEEQETEALNGTPVNVPCSCAPRFFLEGLSRNDPSTDGCGDCSQFDGFNSRGFKKDHCEKEATRRRPPFKASFIRVLTICGGRKNDAETCLDSPWHEGGRPSPCNPCHSETSFRPNVSRSSLFHRSPVDPPVSSITANSSNVSVGGNHGTSSSNTFPNRRSTWRSRSCTASMRYSVNSKRHGRNIRMEKKATKVLGIVFFTFVILWAPFFIINLLLGVCPLCIHNIGEDVINFVTWLGYISSMVNPFFYTFFNKSFRDAFVKIIKCNLRNRRKYHF